MTKRLNGRANKAAGKDGSAQYPRDPNDWYCEDRPPVEQLADAIDFGDDVIWDPSCGRGNILDVFAGRGHEVIGSDIIDRFKPGGHRFYRGNFLQVTKWPTAMGGRRLSIVNNPPYNRPTEGIAEEFIHRALNMIPFHLAAFLVPIEFLAGQGRYERLYSKRRPAFIGILSERPSMPPGEAVTALGDDAFKNGMADYVWIVWKEGGPYRTETLFLRPSSIDDPLSYPPRRLRDRSGRALSAPINGTL